jgi:hypothetical protein
MGADIPSIHHEESKGRERSEDEAKVVCHWQRSEESNETLLTVSRWILRSTQNDGMQYKRTRGLLLQILRVS